MPSINVMCLIKSGIYTDVCALSRPLRLYLVFLAMPMTDLQNLLQSLALQLQVFVQLPPPVLQSFKEMVDFQAAAVGPLHEFWIYIRPLRFEFLYELSKVMAFV